MSSSELAEIADRTKTAIPRDRIARGEALFFSADRGSHVLGGGRAGHRFGENAVAFVKDIWMVRPGRSRLARKLRAAAADTEAVTYHSQENPSSSGSTGDCDHCEDKAVFAAPEGLLCAKHALDVIQGKEDWIPLLRTPDGNEPAPEAEGLD